MKRNKLIIYILFFLLLFPFVVKAEVCNKEDIKIEKIELNELKGNAEETSTASNENNTINLNTKMNVIGDSLTYKVVIKNTSNSDYVFDKNQITKDYINYDIFYDDNSNIVKAGEEKTIYLRLNYQEKPQVENLSNGVLKENNQVAFHLINDNGDILNPETRNKIIIALIIIILSVGLSIILIKNNHKTPVMMIIISLLLIPYIVNAICTCTLEINLKLEIDAKEATFLPGEEVNGKMKQLAGDDISTVTNAYTLPNQTITAIKYSEEEPENSNKEEKNIVSTSDSEYPIYMWFENGTIYWWSEDQTPSLNENASSMFYRINSLNNIEGLETYDVSNTTNMNYLLAQSKLESISKLRSWNTSSTKTMIGTFLSNTKLLNLDGLEEWDTSNVTDMHALFSHEFLLNDASAIKNWDVSKVKSMSMLFACNYELEEIDLSNWNTDSLTDMSYMFASLENTQDYSLISKLKRIYFSKKFDVSKVTAMNVLFYNDRYIEDYNFLRDWDVSNVTDMMSIFQRNKNLKSFDYVKDWNVSKVENMYLFCAGCGGITTLDGLENWDVSSVTTMERMFYGDTNITDSSAINDWNITNVTNFANMFYNVTNKPEFTKVQGTWQANGTFIPTE